MKIGIITLWQSSDNYGQQLQCWALQQLLTKMGHEPFLIQYDFLGRSNYPLWKGILRKMKPGKVISYICNYKTRQNKKNNDVKRAFEDFRKKNIVSSKHIYHTLKELQRNPPVADVFITGSDQVWAQLLNYKENEVFFLNFGKEDIIRISFAASFAMNRYPEELKIALKQQLKKFDLVTVRENTGIAICQELSIDAKKMLDPTLLIGKSFYDKLLPNTSNTHRYIYIYSINIRNSEDIQYDKIKKYCHDNGLNIRCTCASGYFDAKELFDGIEYDYSTIGGWLQNIADSEFIVTTSFHGIVFSIIYSKQFIYFPLKGTLEKSNNRVIDLLHDLGLEQFIAYDNMDIERFLNNNVDWSEVHNKLMKMKSESLKLLNF